MDRAELVAYIRQHPAEPIAVDSFTPALPQIMHSYSFQLIRLEKESPVLRRFISCNLRAWHLLAAISDQMMDGRVKAGDLLKLIEDCDCILNIVASKQRYQAYEEAAIASYHTHTKNIGLQIETLSELLSALQSNIPPPISNR